MAAEVEYIKGQENAMEHPDIHPRQAHPWDYQPEIETAKNFIYFQIYLDLGVERTLRKVWENTKGGKMPGVAPYAFNSIKRLALTANWKQRSDAWDTHVLQKWTENREDRVHKMVLNHIKDAQKFHKKIMHEMTENCEEVDVDKKAYYFDAMTRAYERMARLERISNGEVVEFDGLRLQGDYTTKDLDKLLKDPEMTADLTTLLSRVDEKLDVYKKEAEKIDEEENPDPHKKKEFENLYDKEEIIKKEKENWWE